MTTNKSKIKIAFVGAGGHTNSVADSVNKNDFEIVGVYDDNFENIKSRWHLLGATSQIEEDSVKGVFDKIFISIGSNKVRKNILTGLKTLSADFFLNIIAEDAYVSPEAKVEGVNIFIGRSAYVGPYTEINSNTLINTHAIIEHDCILGENSSLAPRVVVNGFCKIGKNCQIAAGAIVINHIEIADNILVGAGATVVCNLKEQGTYLGLPAKKI